MIILKELTQRLLNKGSSGFQGSMLQYKPDFNSVVFVWETSLSKEDFLKERMPLFLESIDISDKYEAKGEWDKPSEEAISFSFHTPNKIGDLEGIFSDESLVLEETISYGSTSKWQLRAFFPNVSKPEDINEELYEECLQVCSYLERVPLWVEDESALTLRVNGTIDFEPSRFSFYEEDFVQENKGKSEDWQFSLLDLKNQGYSKEQVLEMYELLDNPVVEESFIEGVPDTSSVVKDYGIVEDTLLGKELVYFKIGSSNLEYRYETDGMDARDALNAYIENVKQTKSLGVSWNKFVKYSPDWHEVMSSRKSLEDRGMGDTYISPKDISSSVAAAKYSSQNIDRRTGRRF